MLRSLVFFLGLALIFICICFYCCPVALNSHKNPCGIVIPHSFLKSKPPNEIKSSFFGGTFAFSAMMMSSSFCEFPCTK